MTCVLGALAHTVSLFPISFRRKMRFFPKFLTTFCQLVPDARKMFLEALLELKSECMMDQVNFRARGNVWHLPPGLLGLMS